MTTSRRWALRSILLTGFVACFGCNPFLLPMFLKGESRKPAMLKGLAVKDDKTKEVKIAIVASGRLDARQELMNVNRELAQKVAAQMRELAKYNEENLVIIEPRKVEQYLANHPGWREMDPTDLAAELKAKLKADYVIDIEINSMSLYEEGVRDLYRGRADLHVTLLNTNDTQDGPHHKDVRALYPNEIAGGVPADLDTNLFDFRGKFLESLAKKVAFCFCDHPTINQMDDSRPRLAD